MYFACLDLFSCLLIDFNFFFYIGSHGVKVNLELNIVEPGLELPTLLPLCLLSAESQVHTTTFSCAFRTALSLPPSRFPLFVFFLLMSRVLAELRNQVLLWKQRVYVTWLVIDHISYFQFSENENWSLSAQSPGRPIQGLMFLTYCRISPISPHIISWGWESGIRMAEFPTQTNSSFGRKHHQLETIMT